MSTREAKGPVALSLGVTLCYAAGGLADSIKAVASGLYLLFFYTTVLGLPARLVGVAAALSLAWDAFIDPVIGRLSDRTGGPLGRRHGWMLAGSVGMTVGFVGLFTPPTGLSTVSLVAWLFAVSLVLRTGQSMFTVPYFALGAELDSDYDGRTTVASWRAVAAQAGAITASGVAIRLFFSDPASAPRLAVASYSHMALGLGALLGAAGLTATLGTWTRRSHATAAGDPARDRRQSIRWRPLLRNRAFLAVTGSAALFFMSSVIIAALSMYFLTFYARLEASGTLAACQFALYGGAILGVPVWVRLARRHDKQHLHLAACLLTGGLVVLAFWILRVDGLFDSAIARTLVGGYLLAGATGSAVLVLPSSMLADVIAEHELRSGERAEGMFFGAFSCGQQVSAGAAAVTAALLVDYFAGLRPGAAEQLPGTITRIGILATIVPGLLMMTAGLVILPYRLTRDGAAAVRAALDDRHNS